MTYCTICGRVAIEKSGFCRYHQDALKSLKSSYERWRETSGVSWEEYIEKLCQIDETGHWVVDVAEQIMSGDDPSTPT